MGGEARRPTGSERPRGQIPGNYLPPRGPFWVAFSGAGPIGGRPKEETLGALQLLDSKGLEMEPTGGFEPSTVALRMRCSAS